MSKNSYAQQLQKKEDINGMTTAKLIMTIFGWFGVPLYVYAWVINLDNAKSTILFIVALSITLVRFGFWIQRAMHNNRLKQLDIMAKENEAYEKRLELDEKRAEQIREELSLRVTGLSEKERQERRNRNNY